MWIFFGIVYETGSRYSILLENQNFRTWVFNAFLKNINMINIVFYFCILNMLGVIFMPQLSTCPKKGTISADP